MHLRHFRAPFALSLLLLGTAVAPASAAEPPASPSAAAPAARGVDPTMQTLMAYAAALETGALPFPADATPSEADPGHYRLYEVPSDGVDTSMAVADGANGTPASLQGLFWMDGNPLPDEVVSFAGATWDAEQRTARLPVYDTRIWSWHDDLAGRALYAFVRGVALVYELRLDEARTFAEITPIVHVAGKAVRVPSEVVRFTARLAEDGLWIRESYLFGKLFNTYDFRRIVRGDGTREATFDAYAKAAPVRSLLAERVR